MDELFGLSMDIIAVAVTAITAAIFLALGYLAWRNPVMFKNGLRNIPRRKTQTALIVFGLMLATVIMTAAFSTGDTVSSSVTGDIYRIAGETDELIVWNAEDNPAPEQDQVIPREFADELIARFAGDPDIEGFAPFQYESLPVINPRTGLNESAATIMAYDTANMTAFGDLRDLDGNRIVLSGNQAVVNEDLVEEVDAQPGDMLTLLYAGTPVEVEVVGIGPNSFLTGALQVGATSFPGAAVSLDFLSSLTGRADTIDGIAVTNKGDERSGVDRADAVEQKLSAALEGTPYEVDPIKKDSLELAQLIGSVFTTIFVVFGLFSIAAGVLLIFLIFIMLAAERKPEMGMARAVGAKRRHLVESFLAEGMGYDLFSALAGLVLGMGVTVVMVTLVNSFAEEGLGLNLRVTFTPRGLLVAFCLGIIATFLVIAIAAVRASRLNITAAIRDLPESRPINPEEATLFGYGRGALNAFVMAGYFFVSLVLAGLFSQVGWLFGLGAVLALVGPFLFVLRGSNFAAPHDERLRGERIPLWPFFLVLPIPFYLAAILVTWLTRDRRPSSVPAWLIILAIAVMPLGLVMVVMQDRDRHIPWAAGFGVVAAALGVFSTWLGLDIDSQFLFAGGTSLVFFSFALTLRYFRIHERLTFTVVGGLLLAFWYLAPTGFFDPITGELEGDIEMFFLSGIVLVAAATFVAVYNLDILLPLVGAFGSRLGRIVPAVKTAVAYPLTSRSRTGLTIAMIGLIMFALVVNSTLNDNFSRIFLSDDAKGGYDVLLTGNANNQIEEIGAALAEAGVDTTPIEATGSARLAFSWETEVLDPAYDGGPPEDQYKGYPVRGVGDDFLASNRIGFKYRAAGYDSDEAVWQAMLNDGNLAVVDGQLLTEPEGFGPPMDLLHIDMPIADDFEPFTLTLHNPVSGEDTVVTVIGQMDEAATSFYQGIVVREETLRQAFPDARNQFFYFRLREGADSREYARAVESGLPLVSAESLDKILDDNRAASAGFLLLFQGFMGLGLIVGIAALGVIAFRAVVERRQQIGMLRAIGYQRSMVALSFLLESGFVALSGITMGLVLGLTFSWVIFTSGTVGEEAEGAPFVVPWLQVLLVAAIALAASLLMTFFPARSASRVPVAEALRYE